MAIITLGGSSDQWSGDANGHGGVLLYDANNRPLSPASTGEYAAPIQFRHTAADVAGSTIWDLRGPPTLSAYVKAVHGIMCFDGTATAATTMRYGFYRGSGSVSPTGGVALAEIKKKTTFPTAGSAVQGNGVLVTTGITFDPNAFAVTAMTASPTGGVIRFNLRYDMPEELDSPFVFGLNEHLAIRLETAAVIGLGIYGMVEWAER